ncbi:MAG: SMC-Scp complex subunit ScpB [Steroidobacteraceae bacterium]|nr:SMC-Scp complex subunit ScpB [Steroidobacteraceae bacterium]
MNESYIKNVIEAALLAAGRPLQIAELAALFDEASRPAPAAIRDALTTLEADYAERGIEVKETATGFRIQVRRELANEVSRLWPERPPRYSRALLETLALIAYRQPITRAEIEAVRGVAVNPNIIKTLMERNWVRVVGQRDVPGRPELLATTKEFLDYFGLKSLEDLPPLEELKAMGDVNLQLDLAKAPDGAQGSNAAEGQPDAAAADGAASDSNTAADTTSEAASTAGQESSSEPASATAEPADAASTADEASASGEPEDDDSNDGAPTAEADASPAADADFEDDAADDAADEEELSADADDSKELVAAPHRFED